MCIYIYIYIYMRCPQWGNVFAAQTDARDRKLRVHGKGSICKGCFLRFQRLAAHPCLVFLGS